MGCNPVEDVCSYRLSSDDTCYYDEKCNRESVEEDDEESVHTSLEASLCYRLGSLEEERYRHRHHREHARSQKHCKSPEDGLKDKSPWEGCLLFCSRCSHFEVIVFCLTCTTCTCVGKDGSCHHCFTGCYLHILCNDYFIIIVACRISEFIGFFNRCTQFIRFSYEFSSFDSKVLEFGSGELVCKGIGVVTFSNLTGKDDSCLVTFARLDM